MQPTEDERVLAALSHAGIITNIAGMSGLVGAALIWVTQREKSAYVRAQAFQALAFQGCALLVGVLMVMLWGGCLGLALLPAALFPDLYHTSPPPLFWPALYSAVLPLLYGVLVVCYGLYGAAQTYQGRPFRYLLVGRLSAAPAAPEAPPAEPAAPEPPAGAAEPPQP